MNKTVFDKLKEYHFEFKHLTVLFIIIFSFQLLVSFINKSSVKNTVSNTQDWYQKDSAEKLANLTATSLELIIETVDPKGKLNTEESNKIAQSFNIILSQQKLQHNIDEICIFVNKKGKTYVIDDGRVLYSYLFDGEDIPAKSDISHSKALSLYNENKEQIVDKEQIVSILIDKKTFNIFVPFVVRGECIGAVYMQNTPDFSFITGQLISNYDETSMIYLSLILLGLLAMYFISSYTVKERDEAQKLLFEEHEENLKKNFDYEKELVFTKRIYHTHHKAEKVMGFIKEDLRMLSPESITEIKERVSKYANFVSRVIYDMKWFDPPVQTIRNQIFNTDLNQVIRFIIKHIFQRVYSKKNAYAIKLQLDEKLPRLQINEFVVWEILEPLIQNSIDHNSEHDLVITITTIYNEAAGLSYVTIEDNGKGIMPGLLEKEAGGIKKLFMENISTKESKMQNSGYGCYIAYNMCRRCGWEIDVENNPVHGAKFTITIK